MKSIRIIDRPCGTGKTTDLLSSFSSQEKYIVIVPYLSEVDRILKNSVCDFYAPEVEGENTTKRESLLELAIAGKNIATTHKMFERLVSISRQGYLDGYNLIIDEVPEAVKVSYTLSKSSISDIYLDGGYIIVDSNGLVSPTPKWLKKQEEFKDTLANKLIEQASTGCLYLSENQFFLWCMPIELLTNCISTTILTYKSEGSVLCKYLDKEGIPYVVDSSSVLEEIFKNKARHLINLQLLPESITSLKWSFNKQATFTRAQRKKIQVALKNLRSKHLVGIDAENILLTCSKDLWYDGVKVKGIKTDSRLSQVNWIANTTRGTNDYSHCTHAVYLYDQHLNPAIVRWLSVQDKNQFNNDYALTEFIQWLYRSRVRNGESVTVYFASLRMFSLVNNWLND